MTNVDLNVNQSNRRGLPSTSTVFQLVATPTKQFFCFAGKFNLLHLLWIPSFFKTKTRLKQKGEFAITILNRGGFRGGGGGRGVFGRTPSGIRPPADPKGHPFDTFSEIHFWPTDPKIFLKAPLAPIYTNFEGERAPKKN